MFRTHAWVPGCLGAWEGGPVVPGPPGLGPPWDVPERPAPEDLRPVRPRAVRPRVEFGLGLGKVTDNA